MNDSMTKNKQSWSGFLWLLVSLLLLLTPEALTAQVQAGEKIKVTGRVLDKAGEPVIGGSVLQKGTNIGVSTDKEGNFNIELPRGAVIVVGFLGFATQEVTVTDQPMTIILEEDSKILDEVVVTGYATQKRVTLTGAVSSTGATAISRSVASTTSGAIVGKLAGVNSRQTDGRPGSSTTINIRNMGTPLYVIDGIQKTQREFDHIDFNDIESISILKDASASIYGVRAGNGVVVVTTKRGKRGEGHHVNVNTNYGWQSLFRFPEPADAPTYIRAYMQSDAIQGRSLRFTPDDLAKWTAGTEKGYVPFDWYNYVLTTAPQWYVGANASGGSESINYYISLSHIDQTDVIVDYGGFYRTNAQISVDANITKKLKVGASFNGRIEEKDRPATRNSDDQYQALFGIYRNLPFQRPFANDNPNYPALTQQADVNFGILKNYRSGHINDKWRVMHLNFNAEYEILPGLKVEGKFGYSLEQYWFERQQYTYKLYGYDEATDTYPVRIEVNNPYRELKISDVEGFNTQFQLSYSKQFAEKHNINTFLVAESYLRETPSLSVFENPASNALKLIEFPTLSNISHGGKQTEARLGYAGRLNYNYDEKYLFEFSARYDGSWKFKPEKRWGFFPSASAGWRISEEGFWKNTAINNYMNELKIRASYGLTGLDDVSNYSAFDYMSGYNYRNGGAVIDGGYVVGAIPRGLPNTTLSWMEAKTLNVGFEFQMFNGRLSAQFDYFRRLLDGVSAQRNDVLIPSEMGFGLPYENLNSYVTTGVDGALTWRDKVRILGDDLHYSVGGNFTFARMYDWYRYNELFNHSWHEYRNSQWHRYGFISRWGYRVIGQFQSWEEIANYPVDNDGQGNRTMRPGDFIYADLNGDNLINGYDDRPIGYREGATPYLNFALNLGFEWKGIDIAADFTGAAFASYYMYNEAREPFHDGGNNPQYYLENQWRLNDPTDPNSALIPGKYPTVLDGNREHINYMHNNDFWCLSVNYLKLRNFEIGYTLPKKWTKKAGIEKVRFYSLMQNLFSIDNLGDVDIDPEITAGTGINYPTLRIINFGVNLTF
jgi:TonB-linked SusC/RagA family outer membrane protein